MGEDLRRIFEDRADGVPQDGAPLLGVFGEGIPLPLLFTTGARCADVKAPPLADEHSGPNLAEVDAIAEPFLDDFACRFLHRFAAGCFDKFDALIFARDDVAGLTAYQYAGELRRQGMVSGDGPKLHLWNLIHTRSDAARTFNLTELQRLIGFLTELGLTPDPSKLPDILGLEKRRRDLLDQLDVSGVDRFVYRAAGRWMRLEDHVQALEQIKPRSDQRHDTSNKRIGLIGTASDAIALRTVCEAHGTLDQDLTPFGDIWPFALDGISSFEDLIEAIAQMPGHIRTSPADQFGTELLSRLHHCDLVISAVDRNDDSFGWEVPGLKSALTSNGSRFVDLGFMPFRPDAEWTQAASTKIAEATQ